MMARPPNCNSVPFQMYGTRRQPRYDRCVSERKPITARNGAAISGSEIVIATSDAGTPSSTIITRFSVPISSTVAMPTDTWNNDSRSSLRSGSLRRRRIGERQEPRAEFCQLGDDRAIETAHEEKTVRRSDRRTRRANGAGAT